MGDFSRDPRERLHDALGKHYVGVRLQQGVPILDTDWNESEDLRKHELRSLFRHFFGDGAPDDNAGFQIEAEAAPSELPLEPEESRIENFSLFGPSGAPVDSAGTLTARATLVAEGGAPVADGKSQTLEIPFVVVASS